MSTFRLIRAQVLPHGERSQGDRGPTGTESNQMFVCYHAKLALFRNGISAPFGVF